MRSAQLEKVQRQARKKWNRSKRRKFIHTGIMLMAAPLNPLGNYVQCVGKEEKRNYGIDYYCLFYDFSHSLPLAVTQMEMEM